MGWSFKKIAGAALTGGLSLATGFGDKKPGQAPAGETPEQRLVRMQLEEYDRQKTEEELFRPEYYRTQGYMLDPTTQQYRKMTDEEKVGSMTGSERSSYDIQSLANERTLKAMKGELAIDPAVEKDIANTEDATRAELTQQLGTGYAISTPGMKRLEEMKAKANALRNQLRTGEISTAEGLSSGRGAQLSGIAQNYSNLQDSSGSMGVSGNLVGYYAQQRQAEQERADRIKAARKASYAQIGGAGIGAAGAAIGSSRDFKNNVVLVSDREDDALLEQISMTPLSRYNYKPEISDEMGDDGREHLGLIVEDAPDVLKTRHNKAIDLYDMNAMLWASVRSLNREVVRLRSMLEPVK